MEIRSGKGGRTRTQAEPTGMLSPGLVICVQPGLADQKTTYPYYGICHSSSALMPNAASTLVHERSTDVGHRSSYAGAAAAAAAAVAAAAVAAGDDTAASPQQLAGMGSCAAHVVATPPAGLAAMDDSQAVAAQHADQDRQQEIRMTCLQPSIMSQSALCYLLLVWAEDWNKVHGEARQKSAYVHIEAKKDA